MELRRQEPDWLSQLFNLTDESARDGRGLNILHVACNFSNLALAKEVVEMAIRNKSELTSTTTMCGNSALHYAAYKGQAEVIELRITNGARPDVQNVRGLTPLHIALSEQRFATVNVTVLD